MEVIAWCIDIWMKSRCWKVHQTNKSHASQKSDIIVHHLDTRRITEILSSIHYIDAIMSAMGSQFTSLTIVYSTVYSDADHRKHRKHQSSASLAFVQGIHRGPVNSPHKWPVAQKMYPSEDAIMNRGDSNVVIDHRILCILFPFVF